MVWRNTPRQFADERQVKRHWLNSVTEQRRMQNRQNSHPNNRLNQNATGAHENYFMGGLIW
jgi:hypothetical protein